MNEKIDELDMTKELFISARAPFTTLIPPKAEADYLLDLRQGALGDKLPAIQALISLYRARAAQTQRYTKEVAAEIAAILTEFASGSELCEAASEQLFAEGSRCENTGDYQGAVWFYLASLNFAHKDPEFQYYRLNNLGFCLLCLKKFKEAADYLESAVAIMPKRYNAWKNFGAAMEYQGKIQMAAQAYMRAINFSHAEKRSVNHLMRLVSRHAELRAIANVAGYLDSLVKAGVINTTGQA